MSGRKRATVSLNQKDRKQVEESSDRFLRLEQDILAIRARVQQNRQEELDHTIQDVANRQTQFSDSIYGIDEQLREIEDRTSSQLVEQANLFFQQTNAVGNEVLEQTTNIVDDYSNRLWAVVEENAISQQAQFRRMNEYLSGQKKNAHSRQRIARSVLESAISMNETLKQIYSQETDRAEFFMEMDQRLHMAWQNLEAGFLDAALLAGQEAYLNLSKFRLEIENFILLRQFHLNQTANKFETLYQSIQHSQSIHTMDLAGNLLEFEIDTNQWTQGRLADLETEVSHYVTQFYQLPVQAFSLEDLSQLGIYADKLMDELSKIIQQARLEVLDSQARFDIAETVKQALYEKGYDLVHGDYLNEDQRDGYGMTLTNGEQDEINIQIMSIPGQFSSYDLQMETVHPELHTQHELRMRGKELFARLAKYGLQVGRLQIGMPVVPNIDQIEPQDSPETNAPPSDADREEKKKLPGQGMIKFKKP